LSEMGYWQPGRGWKTTTNRPVAGEYRAIALDLQGISPTQAEALKTDLEATQAKITAEDYTDLGKQQLVGDLLYSTILSYFVLNNIQDDLGARAANMVSYKAPSYGLFKTNVIPQYWFGIPRNVTIEGLTMDVDHITHLLVHESNDTDLWIAYNRASGARLSAMEHLVPEQMFSTEDNP
ncbi:transglutaminase domain-containing protein, partial [Oceanobacter sp. wDCs-4]